MGPNQENKDISLTEDKPPIEVIIGGKDDNQLQPIITNFDPKELRRLNKLKLTKAKQNKFIDLYSKCPNMAKCAKSVGISVTAITNTMTRDPEFKALIMDCRANVGEDLKEAMVMVGRTPDARGANDRNRYLQAYDDAFKRNPEIQVNTQINFEPDGQVKSILSRILPNDDV